MSKSLQLHGLQHASLLCPALSSGVCSDSCLLSRWCHPTISSSVVPFSSCLQSFPASGSFPMSQLFASGGQSVEASASVLPVNIQDWFSSGWTGLISLLSKSLPYHQSSKASILKLKLQCFGQLMWRDNLLEKTLRLGKIEGRWRRGWQRTRWLDDVIDSNGQESVHWNQRALSHWTPRTGANSRRWWRTCAAVHGVAKSWTQLSKWTTMYIWVCAHFWVCYEPASVIFSLSMYTCWYGYILGAFLLGLCKCELS